MSSKMPICSAIDKYGYDNFHIYILEVCSIGITKKDHSLREAYWYNLIKPTYDSEAVLEPFTGSNHHLFGKSLPDSTREKISVTLKGRRKTELERSQP